MFGNTIIKVNKSSYEKLQESFQKLPNKTFSLILYEEEIYVGSIEIPTVRKKWVSGMVQSSLIHTFEEIDKLSYSYEIVSKMKGMYSIRLFCINSERNELFHHMVGRSRISSVYLIQFCYIHYVFSMLRRRDYILIFGTNDFTYILFCFNATLHKSFLLENEVAKYSNISTKIESIFKDAAADTGIRKIPVVFINFEFKDIIEKLSYSYYVYDVGRIDEDKIIKKYIGVL